MSDLPDDELSQSSRRSARNSIFFGGFFIALGSVLMIVAHGHLWEPLGRFRPIPQILVYGLMLVAGLVLVIVSIVNLVALRRSRHEPDVGSVEPPVR